MLFPKLIRSNSGKLVVARARSWQGHDHGRGRRPRRTAPSFRLHLPTSRSPRSGAPTGPVRIALCTRGRPGTVDPTNAVPIKHVPKHVVTSATDRGRVRRPRRTAPSFRVHLPTSWSPRSGAPNGPVRISLCTRGRPGTVDPTNAVPIEHVPKHVVTSATDRGSGPPSSADRTVFPTPPPNLVVAAEPVGAGRGDGQTPAEISAPAAPSWSARHCAHDGPKGRRCRGCHPPG